MTLGCHQSEEADRKADLPGLLLAYLTPSQTQIPSLLPCDDTTKEVRSSI